MAQPDQPDPIADWLRHNRTRLAWIAWILLMVSGLPDLLEGTLDGAVDFLYHALFVGILAWGWGSRLDRTEPRYWQRFAFAWSGMLAVQAALTVLVLVRGNDLTVGWLVSVGVVLVFFVGYWLGYHRVTRRTEQPPA